MFHLFYVVLYIVKTETDRFFLDSFSDFSAARPNSLGRPIILSSV